MFVDINGVTTNEMKCKTHVDGPQTISFFLKTVCAQEADPRAATFTACDNANANAQPVPSGMDISRAGDDGSSSCSAPNAHA